MGMLGACLLAAGRFLELGIAGRAALVDDLAVGLLDLLPVEAPRELALLQNLCHRWASQEQSQQREEQAARVGHGWAGRGSNAGPWGRVDRSVTLEPYRRRPDSPTVVVLEDCSSPGVLHHPAAGIEGVTRRKGCASAADAAPLRSRDRCSLAAAGMGLSRAPLARRCSRGCGGPCALKLGGLPRCTPRLRCAAQSGCGPAVLAHGKVKKLPCFHGCPSTPVPRE
jgi:hypothetical protein